MGYPLFSLMFQYVIIDVFCFAGNFLESFSYNKKHIFVDNNFSLALLWIHRLIVHWSNVWFPKSYLEFIIRGLLAYEYLAPVCVWEKKRLGF